MCCFFLPTVFFWVSLATVLDCWRFQPTLTAFQASIDLKDLQSHGSLWMVNPVGGWVKKKAGNKKDTLQGINISHLGKRKIIDSKCHFWGDMLVPWRVHSGKLTVFTPKNDGFPIGISELPGGYEKRKFNSEFAPEKSMVGRRSLPFGAR